jgi:RNA 3'-terminal phosphate cyclase
MVEIDGSMGEGGGQVLRTALSLALAGGGRFVTSAVTSHAATNARVIEAFGLARITFESRGNGVVCRVES